MCVQDASKYCASLTSHQVAQWGRYNQSSLVGPFRRRGILAAPMSAWWMPKRQRIRWTVWLNSHRSGVKSIQPSPPPRRFMRYLWNAQCSRCEIWQARKAHFRNAWWGKVNISQSVILHNWFCVDLESLYQTVFGHLRTQSVCLGTCYMCNAPTQYYNDQNVCMAHMMYVLCLAAMCRHWGETCDKCNGILIYVDPRWENLPFSSCPLVALWVVNPAYCTTMNACFLLFNPWVSLHLYLSFFLPLLVPPLGFPPWAVGPRQGLPQGAGWVELWG